jgi:aspartate/methionine/tyrosine aminotransferase
LNSFLRERDDIEGVPTRFGTTSFPRLRDGNVEKLSTLLIEKCETAVVPGRFFESPSHIRIGMCCEPELFTAGVERLGKALDELRR